MPLAVEDRQSDGQLRKSLGESLHKIALGDFGIHDGVYVGGIVHPARLKPQGAHVEPVWLHRSFRCYRYSVGGVFTVGLMGKVEERGTCGTGEGLFPEARYKVTVGAVGPDNASGLV